MGEDAKALIFVPFSSFVSIRAVINPSVNKKEKKKKRKKKYSIDNYDRVYVPARRKKKIKPGHGGVCVSSLTEALVRGR